MPRYRKRAGRNTAFVEYQGKRVQLPGVHNSLESRQAYTKFLLDHGILPSEDTPAVPASVVTVGAVVLEFLKHCDKRYLDPRGERAIIGEALKLLVQHYLTMPAASFGPLQLQELREKHIATGNSRSYVNGQIARVKRCFRWATTKELYPGEKWHALQAVPSLAAGETSAPDRPPVEPIEWKYVAATVAESNDNIAAMILAQWFIGCRAGSLCRMKPEQIDRREPIWKWQPRHKQEHRRKRKLVLAIGPRAQRVLEPFLLRRQPGEYVFNPREIRNSSRYGIRYDRKNYNQAITRAIARANEKLARAEKLRELMQPDSPPLDRIPHWTSHQLRHAKGHDTSERYGAAATQAVLGHDSTKATRVYASARVEIERILADENEARRLELATRVATETG